MTPLGEVVEIDVLSVVLPMPDPEETTIELDTALVLKAGGWRLLIESIEHTDYDWLGPDLVLTTDPDTIDERLSHGTVRQLDQPRQT